MAPFLTNLEIMIFFELTTLGASKQCSQQLHLNRAITDISFTFVLTYEQDRAVAVQTARNIFVSLPNQRFIVY